MLALVHPFNPAQDAPHRVSASSTRPPRPRKTTASAVSSSSRLPLAPAPQLSRPRAHPPRHQSPPRVVRAPTPPPVPVDPPTPAPFDVHSYPSPDLLRLLAALLTQIAATNDKLDAASPAVPPSTTPTRTSLSTLTPTDAPIWRTLTTASRTAVSTPSSVLTFHARNVPTISLEAYLLRILKYCPTTNEVFLSLLVYFDRMSKLSAEATGRTFIIDSYNIHRLVIAGVTVASKFFSDVFYTNSRYAKVGGLPQAELNQLELQFLLLNDFRLVIPTDEMQRYAEQLILFSNSPPPPPAAIRPFPAALPMQAMGAIDAYGGRVPNGVVPPNKTPNTRPRYHDGNDTETETEAETETETDGGWTTDDEPTIRPAHSSAGNSSDDTRSLCSSSADDTDDEGAAMEGVEDEQGDRTPEHANAGERTPERRPGRPDGERTPERAFLVRAART